MQRRTHHPSGARSFVIKTADTKDGTKVFINVCASDKVPAPGNWKTGQMPEEASADRRQNGPQEWTGSTPFRG